MSVSSYGLAVKQVEPENDEHYEYFRWNIERKLKESERKFFLDWASFFGVNGLQYSESSPIFNSSIGHAKVNCIFTGSPSQSPRSFSLNCEGNSFVSVWESSLPPDVLLLD